MITVLSEVEDAVSHPLILRIVRQFLEPGYAESSSLDRGVTWQRLESWIAWRWPTRTVTWIIEGPGDWRPRLYPFTSSAAERWIDGAWTAETLKATPLGGFTLANEGPYRITGTAGDDSNPPAAVIEAFHRLHEFQSGIALTSRNDTARTQDGDTELVRAWAAKAIHLSGAADLLRSYRRAP